jgi:hypothetical protein
MVTDIKGSSDIKSDTWRGLMVFLGDLSDFEYFEVNTVGTDIKGLPDRKSDTWRVIMVFLGELSDFEYFEVNNLNISIYKSGESELDQNNR